MTFDSAISWFEIPAKDINRAQKFYEAVFDIKMQPLDSPDIEMRIFPLTDPMKGVGGALAKTKDFHNPSATDGPLIYLNGNPDVQKYLDKVEAAGGKIMVPKMSLGEYGYMAVFTDTEGNRVALHAIPESMR